MGNSCSRSQDIIVPGVDTLQKLCGISGDTNGVYILPFDLKEMNSRINNENPFVNEAGNVKAPYYAIEITKLSVIKNTKHYGQLRLIGTREYNNTEFALFGTRVPLSQNGGYKKVKKYKKTNTKHSFIYQGKSYIRNIHIGSRGGKYVILNKTYVKLNINSS